MFADTPEGSDTNEDPQKMEDVDPGGGSHVLCSKRMLSTEDPDYARPPDAKRMREMEKKGQMFLRFEMRHLLNFVKDFFFSSSSSS